MKPPREMDILRQCLAYLKLRGFWAWRNNAGALRDRTGRLVRFSPVGSGDLFALLPGGRFLSVEVKRPGGKATAAQLDWLARVAAAGGVAMVVTGVDDLRARLAAAGYEEG